MTADIVQSIALVGIAMGTLWTAAELRDMRKDVAEIWKRMKRPD